MKTNSSEHALESFANALEARWKILEEAFAECLKLAQSNAARMSDWETRIAALEKRTLSTPTAEELKALKEEYSRFRSSARMMTEHLNTLSAILEKK